ncbi:pectinesterase inhibitor-like [Lycium ferocissimum]|uniref:pectinesterase inhibitor-like n=1 Tax=Lycium ferocissimum TaxID=112874 RepID=UPI002816768F|nr:pectinesterase inhibitor-like [Lycium ferocissimum]
MANSLSPSLFSLTFVFLLVVSLFEIVRNVEADILDDVCPKTINPQLCFQVLKNDPYVYKGDIQNLLSIALSIAQDNTTSTYNLVQSLIQQPITDPKVKTQLTNCLNNYKDAGDKLESCNDLLRTADYRKISLLASGALNDSRTCDQGFGQSPAQLKQLSQTVQEFSNLVFVIAYDLK